MSKSPVNRMLMIYWRTLDVFQMQKSQRHIDPPKQCSINSSGVGPLHVDLRGLRPMGCEGAIEGWRHIHKLH